MRARRILSFICESCLIAQVNIRSARFVFGKGWFPFALLFLALFKLWVVHSEDIIGSATEYDALWFVNSAKHWYWNSPYSWTAFMRPPAYPLWIALVHAFHLPQRLAIELLQLSAWFTLVLTFRRSGIPQWLCVIAFAMLALYPGSFQWDDYTMADVFYAAILPFAVAGFIGMMFGSARIWVSILAGLAIAVLWNTREESVLLVLMGGAFVTIWFCRERTVGNSWRIALHKIWKPTTAMTAMSVLLVLIVYGANYRTFKAFAKSEVSSRRFAAVFHALLRIKSDSAQRYIPITSDSLEKAFTVSPTFAFLKPELKGDVGEAWRAESLHGLGIRNEIGINWMIWAVRQAASGAGVYATPAKVDHFYRKIAREINRACDEHRVESRRVIGDFIDPLTAKGWEFLPQSFREIMSLFVLRYEFSIIPDDAILRPDQRAIYDEMTLRGPPSERKIGVSTQAENWIGHGHRFFVIALILSGAVAIITLAFCFRRIRFTDPIYSVVTILFVTVFLRVALFAIINATSWPADMRRFLFPVMPLFNVMLIMLIYQAMSVSKSMIKKSRIVNIY